MHGTFSHFEEETKEHILLAVIFSNIFLDLKYHIEN